MSDYSIQFVKQFNKQYLRLVKKDSLLSEKVNKSISQLRKNPFYPGLRSHVVDEDSLLGNIWSSRVTGDIRILWAFSPTKQLVLILLKIGGHDDVY